MKSRRLNSEELESRNLLAASGFEVDGEEITQLVSDGYHSRAIPTLAATTRVIEPAGDTREFIPNNSGFHIEIVPGLELRSQPGALAAVHRAADQWEAMFFDPITVTIHVDLFSRAQDSPAGVLGLASPVGVEMPYSEVRAAMQSDGLIEGDDEIVARLPDADVIEFAYPAGLSAGENIFLAKANAKALGLHSQEVDDLLGVSDGRILLNPFHDATSNDGRFDFNREDGIEPGSFDFESVVVHEIGHILGFISATDQIDSVDQANSVGPTVTTVSPTPLDLFRFRSLVGPNNPRTPAAFETIRRELRPSTPAVLDFVLESGWSELQTEYPVELGVDAGPNGDFGYQASHWQLEDLFGETIGVMAPALGAQTVSPISNVDLRAFDLIGFDILPPGVPASAPTLNDDQAVITGSDRAVIDVLANDQNNSEALDLATFRIVEPPALGEVAFDPSSGLLVYRPDSVSSDDLDAFTYTIADSRGLFARPALVEVTISGRGVAPVAIDDFVLTRRDQSVTFNPLLNDVDTDDELSIDDLQISAGPSFGTVERVGEGLVYTPNSGFEGTDRIRYSVTDSRGNVDTATIDIAVGTTLVPVVIPGEPLTLLQRADTNRDSSVTPFDALLTMNYLGRRSGQSPVGTMDSEGQRLDVSGDGLVTPFDALVIINLLGQQHAAAQAELVSMNDLAVEDEEERVTEFLLF